MIYTILHRTLKIKENEAQKKPGVNLVALEGYAVLAPLMTHPSHYSCQKIVGKSKRKR